MTNNNRNIDSNIKNHTNKIKINNKTILWFKMIVNLKIQGNFNTL
jgi:hypothetical protein